MSRGRSRYYRSIAISVLALGALLWLAVDQFGVPREELQNLLIGSLLVLLLVVISAALAVSLWMGLRRLLRRGKPRGDDNQAER
jgi:hypothetical protein